MCVILVVLPIAVRAGTKTFDIAIPATTADESIRLLSRQTGHSAIFQSGDVAGIQTNPVQGQYTLHRALDALLAGTGLTARLTEKNVITILYRAQDAGEEDMVTVDKKVGLLASVAAFLLGAGASDEVLAQAEPAADEDRRTLEEIVVTATRREASLQDVGVSVSALSNNFLDEIGANDLNDFFGFVPSVNAASNTIGERGGLNIVIRGISNSRISSGNDSSSLTATTGYYINDIPITPVDTNLFDVNRIEVLRGPQGTLYGAAAMGGAVRVELNKPDLQEFDAAIETTLSAVEDGADTGIGEFGGGAKFMVNIPIMEGILGLRMSGEYRRTPGYIDVIRVPLNDPTNLDGTADFPLNDTLPVALGNALPGFWDDTNTAENVGGRLSLLYTPNENWSVEFLQLLQFEEVDDLNFVSERIRTAEFGRDFTDEKFILEPNESDVTLTALTVNYNSEFFNIVSNTGYYTRHYDETIDFTNATLSQFSGQIDAFPVVGLLTTKIDWETITQEVRIESNREAYGNPFLNRLDWVVGAFLMDEERDRRPLAAAPGFEAATGLALPVGNDINILPDADIKDESKAVFVDANFNITDALMVGAGIRFFDVSSAFDERVLRDSSPVIPNRTVNSQEETDNTIRFGASYRLSDNVNLFTNFSEGFRLGGSIGPPNDIPACVPIIEQFNLGQFADGTFGSDSVETWEAGFKLNFLDGRGLFNATAYHTDWDGLQQQFRLANLLNAPTACPAQVTANVGAAEVDGVDLEIQLLATDQLFLKATAAYTDAQITEGDPTGNTVPGDPIQHVPEWSGSLVARYEAPVSAFGGSTLFVHGDARYIDDRISLTGAHDNPVFQIDAYTLVGLRTGLILGDDQSTTLTFWVKNLLDDEVELNSRPRPGTGQPLVNRGMPRSFGLTLEHSF